MAMVRVPELKPARQAQQWTEERLNSDALTDLERLDAALKACDFIGNPFPVSLPERSYDYLKALLVQRRASL
jgi:hypothetical protein